MRTPFAFVLVLLTLFLASGRSAAATTFYGCFYCKPVSPVGMGATCRQVPDGGAGEGWSCTEVYDLPSPEGPLCYTNGQPCTTVTVSGGGGGVGGGQTCQVGGASFCPAECFSCGGFGRPAI